MRVVGADAYNKGWVAVVLDGLQFVAATVHSSARGMAETYPDAAAIGIDIPIGLPLMGTRQADALARTFVGPRASSVFTAPPRRVLEAADYTTARRISRETWGRGVSAQSYRLGPKILEVDDLAARDSRVFEIHPEVSFRALAGRPLMFYKKKWNGQMERRTALASAGIVIPDILPADVGVVPPDDILDACVAAWSSWRKARGEVTSLPEPPERDDRGREVAIWY